MKKAFTIIELLFVIVVIGILAAIAIPKLTATRDDADIAKYVYSIKSSINEISSYIFSQGEVYDDITLMSDILKSLKPTKNISKRMVSLKIGEISNCVNIFIEDKISSQDSPLKSLKVNYGNNKNDEICKGVQQLLKEKSYDIPISGNYTKR